MHLARSSLHLSSPSGALCVVKQRLFSVYALRKLRALFLLHARPRTATPPHACLAVSPNQHRAVAANGRMSARGGYRCKCVVLCKETHVNRRELMSCIWDSISVLVASSFCIIVSLSCLRSLRKAKALATEATSPTSRNIVVVAAHT